MRFGICEKYENLEIVEQAGMNYIECTVVGLNEITEEQFNNFKERLKASKIKCEVLSVLFSGDTIPLIGENTDRNEIKRYLNKAFERVMTVKPEIIVFGSGKARMCPVNFNREKAQEQLIEICGIIAEAAEPYDATIALEPLNKTETNMVNSLAQALEIVKAVNLPNFKMIADIYHMLVEDEPASEIAKCKDALAHVHIASKTERKCPQISDKDMFESYFKVLDEIGYTERISIEGRVDDLKCQIPQALDLFRSYLL